MQDEVNRKTVALSIRATKLTGRVLASAIWKILEEGKKRHQKALTPQGRQSVKKLMNHYGAKNSMPLVGAPRQFDRIAKEFHVDYAFHKVSPGHYLLFFKAGQADAMTNIRVEGAGFDVTLLLLAAGILAAAFAILQLIRAAYSGRRAA